MQAAFSMNKAKAKARKSVQWPNGIPWEITLEEFTIFAKQTYYLTKKGNEPGSLTIDRIDSAKGYVTGNIRAVTRIENVEKQCREEGRRMEAGYAWRTRY